MQIGFGEIIEYGLGFSGITACESNIKNPFGLLLLGASTFDLDLFSKICCGGAMAAGKGPQQQGAFEQLNQGGDV